MSLRRRVIAASFVVAAIPYLVACSDDAPPTSTPGTASASASVSPTASPTASPSMSASASTEASPGARSVKDYPTATFRAKATGAVTGTMKYPGGGGCRVLENNDPGVAINVGMGVTVPTKKTAVMVLAVAKPGRSQLGGPAFMTVFGYGDVWNTQNTGGHGTVNIGEHGRKGTFDVHMPPNGGGTALDLTGAFTCG